MGTSAPDPEAIILAGGRGHRLGGIDKAALMLDSATLLERALQAVAPGRTVVVAAHTVVPPEVLLTSEHPPGGGPAAGVVAGMQALEVAAERSSRGGTERSGLVVLLAVDQPGVTSATVRRLRAATHADDFGGAVLADGGHRHYTAAIFDRARLLARASERPSWHGCSLRELLDPLVTAEVAAIGDESRDVDTPADWEYWSK